MKITVNDLYYTYPSGVEALRGVTFAISAGEQVAIVGQNGAGKTTLVKHFNGLLHPTRGKVLVGDWDTVQHPVAKLASRVGYVFQNPDEQLFTKNVYDEIAFGPRNIGCQEDRIHELVDDALELTELSAEKKTNPYDLSQTWRKMVAIASIIAMDTAVMIFDEPTTGQDAVSVTRIAHVVEELKRRGKTVITISHDIDFCAENFDRIIALYQGTILLDGPTRVVLAEEERLAETYVDPPQLTRLGKRIGLPEIVTDSRDFLVALKNLAEKNGASGTAAGG